MSPDYISRHEFERHVEDSDGGFRRLEALEAEIMGNFQTGRPSLRTELTSQMNTIDGRMSAIDAKTEKSLAFIKRVSIGVLIAVLVAVILNAFGLKEERSAKKAIDSQQENAK